MNRVRIPKCVKINRNVNGTVRFLDVFGGFDKVPAVKRIFHAKTRKTMQTLMLRISSRPMGYLWIDDKKGRVCIVSRYLRKGNVVHLYLDAVHELVHIRQLHQGKKLFHFPMKYVDWPTEIEAYKLTVKEAKRIGMKKPEIRDYLKVFWASENDMERLHKKVGL